MKNKELKIAVEFFGHLRTYKRCAKSINKNLLKVYDCDVFMHTWDETECRTKVWHNNLIKPIRLDKKTIEKLKKIYNLKDIIVEKQNIPTNDICIPCQYNKGKSQISITGLQSMLYSKQKVNDLRKKYQKKHNIKYDYILMIRPDIKLNKKFILDSIDNEIKIYNPKDIQYCAVNISNKLPIINNLKSDIIYFGTPKIIDKSIEVLNKIDFHKHINDMYNPETLFNLELEKSNILSKAINYQYGKDWLILRKFNTKKIYKSIININTKKNKINITLFKILPFYILSLNLPIFSLLNINITIGDKYD